MNVEFYNRYSKPIVFKMYMKLKYSASGVAQPLEQDGIDNRDRLHFEASIVIFKPGFTIISR